MLMVKPATHMKKKVEMTDVGRARAVMSVDRQSRMKTKITSTAIKPPKMMASRTCATFSLMNSESSCTALICRAGNVARARSSVV